MDKLYAYDISLDDDGVASRTLKLVGTGKRVLEIGCASGSQTKILKQKMGCSVTALEINPEAAECAKPYCEKIIVGSVEKLDIGSILSGEEFDVVLFADVLEHLYDPLGTLRKITPHLRDGGCVVASIPNIGHISVIYDLIYGRFDYKKTGILDDTHIRFFTRRSIIDLFTKAGLKIENLDRGFTELKDEKFFYPKNEDERKVIEFIRTHNPECMTYHFIIKASIEKNGGDDLRFKQAMTEVESLESLVLAKEFSKCTQESQMRKMFSDLALQKKGVISRVLQRLRVK